MNKNCYYCYYCYYCCYRMIAFLIVAAALGTGCSFDYGNQESEEATLPDIVMEYLDYVRVRSGSPQARFTADRAERYDRRRTMELSRIQFEQYNLTTGELDAKGTAGSAEIELASGNVTLKNGIDLSVESEDVTLETDWLAWDDENRALNGKEDSVVVITRSGGTDFRGIGLSADVRSRQWEFANGAEGAFEQDDDDEEDNGEDGDDENDYNEDNDDNEDHDDKQDYNYNKDDGANNREAGGGYDESAK